MTGEAPGPPQRRKEAEGGSGLARRLFRGRFQASALPLVELWAVLRSDSHPAGGVGPACRSIRGRIRASTGPRVERVLPKALGQGGGRQPSPPLVVAGSGLTFPPWVGCRKSAYPGAQKAAWNRCETSGGPGCRAPREALRFAELPTALPGGERRLGTGHETNGGPSRSPPAQPVALEGSRALPGQSLATFF